MPDSYYDDTVACRQLPVSGTTTLMSIASDVIRPFWLPGINEVSGLPRSGLSAWILNEDYQIYDPLEEFTFKIAVGNPSGLVSAFAFDCSRMAVAAIESTAGIAPEQSLPRSIAWAIIRQYYSAYFAGHAILRMLGTSCSQLAVKEIRSVERIAGLFGYSGKTSPRQGLYRCTLDHYKKTLNCVLLRSGAGGVHELFWSVFRERLQLLSTEILTIQGGSLQDQQKVSVKLTELCDNLRRGVPKGGAWLSFIRNEVTYRHKMDAWFPYGSDRSVSGALFRAKHVWCNNPMEIDLGVGGELLRFQRTCAFLVALCRELAVDMARRCPQGRSFHSYGILSILNRLTA